MLAMSYERRGHAGQRDASVQVRSHCLLINNVINLETDPHLHLELAFRGETDDAIFTMAGRNSTKLRLIDRGRDRTKILKQNIKKER